MASEPSKPSRLSWPSLPQFITALVVVVSTAFVVSQLRPDLLFTNTTTAGGDMGAHVWLPDFVKNHLLPHGRLTGWAPDWYNGFPALQFYFPLPTVLVLLLDIVLPYNIAFKLVTVSGLVALPVCAWAFGRLARLPFPAPACLAAGTLPFLFDTGYSIFGGNIASTLAGEYAFSIGLAFAFLFLGVVANGMQTGKMRAIAAVLFGLVVLSHVLPTIFAAVGGIVLFAIRMVTGPQQAEQSDVVDGMYDPYGSPDDRRDPSQRDRRTGLMSGRRASDCAAAADVDEGDRDRETAAGAPVFETPTTDRLRMVKWGLSVGVVGGLLSCFWLIPFVLRMDYLNDMGWEKIEPRMVNGQQVAAYGAQLFQQTINTYTDALFPRSHASFAVLGIAGALLSVWFRRRIGIFWVIIALISAVAFVYMPQGRLWNARLLPFWHLSLFMLSALFIAELGWGFASLVRALRHRHSSYWRDVAEGMTLVTPIIAMAMSLLVVMSALPAPSWWKLNKSFWYHTPTTLAANKGTTTPAPQSFLPSWVAWNYSGYEQKPAYPEFQRLIDVMNKVGQSNGCGRAMWEYESQLNRFGTPMALMLMPKFTNGCIASEEGLFFESSATVPFHFLNQSELSTSPSRAMRGIPYQSLNVSDGISKLQLMGVKYYMAVTPTAQQEAALDPRVTLIASVPAAAATDGTARNWNVYQVANSDIVQSVSYLPTVMTSEASKIPVTSDSRSTTTTTSLSADGQGSADLQAPDPATDKRNARERWLDNAVTWFQTPANHDVMLAADGPANWPRVANADSAPVRVPVDPVKVSYIAQGDDRISFNVDRVGVPVVVKVSYFPNWQVSGADKVYRVAPNQMVVVPTSKHVELHYGETPVDYLGLIMSIAGVAGVIVLVRFAWIRRRDEREDLVAAGEPARD